MNLSLSDEQVFLREAARGALSRFKTVEAARDALEDPGKLPDLWPTAVEAGWPGMLVTEEHGGAGLGVFDAMLVAEEQGRVLAGVPFIGVLPAIAVLEDAGDVALGAAVAGDARVVYVPACPPSDLDEPAWTPDGDADAPGVALRAQISGEAVTVSGRAAFVPDALDAELLVAVAVTDAGDAVAVAVGVDQPAVSVDRAPAYDATRPLAHITFEGASGRRLAVGADQLAQVWHIAQALIAAEAVGAASTALEVMTVYAKERFTFGRAIGSYQSIKHEIVEVLRQVENARSLLFYAGWAGERRPDELALAAAAARASAGSALDFAARANINVHGGIGATWEHDAPLTFRRAQVLRRLYGGHAGAADRVSGELFSAALVGQA